MKRLIISLFMILFLLTGCSNVRKTIVRHAASSVNDHSGLIDISDLVLRIRVTDSLTEDNSFGENGENGLIYDFYSKRKIEILEGFDADKAKLEAIFHSEAVVDGEYFIFEHTRELKKNKEYIVYLTYSESLGGYIIPVFEPAIVPLDSKQASTNDPQANLSEFITLIAMDQDISNEQLRMLAKAKYHESILEYKNVERVEKEVDNIKITYEIANSGAGKTHLEINDLQYEVEGELTSMFPKH